MVRVLEPPNYYAHGFVSANRSNYSHHRPGRRIDRIVIHVTQGSFRSARNWCQNPRANVSWHYLIAQTGYTLQQVSEKNIAYHAGNWFFNRKSVGIEHAGFITDPDMWTDELMDSSARICAGIILRSPYIPNDGFGYHLWGHATIPGATHADPGEYFDWRDYIARIASYL